MSSGSNQASTISLEKSIISSTLHSTLMRQFLFGGYLGFWAFAVVIYAFKSRSPARRMITSFLGGLVIITLLQVALHWYRTCILSLALGVHFDTPHYIRRGVLLTVVDNTLVQVGQALADGLMIWRCWHIASQRRCLRLLVVCFYVAQVCLTITCTAIGFTTRVGAVGEISPLHNYKLFVGIAFLLTAVTSIIATLVIGIQIYTSTRLNARARRRYTHIIEIIVQSSALYSLGILCQAVASLIEHRSWKFPASVLFNAEKYIAGIMTFTTAFAPTLMLARLSIEKDKDAEPLSTNIISTWQVETLRFAFAAQPLESYDTDIQNNSLDDRFGKSRTGEV